MSETLIVNAVHIVTFCWVLSRAFAPYRAWRPNYLDTLSALIAVGTYLAMLASVLSRGALNTIAEMGEIPLIAAVVFVALAGVYIGLTWTFVRVRVWVNRVFGR